jgi:hypothetical protein
VSEAKAGAGRTILAIVGAGIWVGVCEFVRNQFLLASQWQNHYREMGLEFPSKPANGAMWMVWSFLMAGTIFAISRRFNLWQTTFIAWVMGYVMMWAVIWNLAVLPVGILPVAIPFSFVEALGAAFICRRSRGPADSRGFGPGPQGAHFGGNQRTPVRVK